MLWIAILGGLLIMMGQHDRSEALFYYFRLEDQIPETHLLRLIEKHISFAFVRQQLKGSYSETGRPSIDPELLLRILLIGYLYGISSERKLVEELRMHLAWRWFTGLGFDQEIPHHSTFSKNRHGRFQESKLFEQLFEQIVRQCVEVGLVSGKDLSVDGSFVEANAAKESRIPREQLAEAAQVHQTVRQYLREVEEQNPVEEPVHEQDQVSTTDPDSTYATKGGTPARMGYYDNYLVDNASCVIVGVQGTAARMSQETVAAQDMLTRFTQWQGREPESVAADTTYGNGEFLQWLADRSITPYMRTRDSIHRKRSPFFGPDRFIYEPENNRYLCWPVPQLRWPSLSQSSLQLHRDTKKVWPVLAPATMHQCCLPGSYHPPERTRPTTCARVAQHARVRQSAAAKKKGGSLVRGTEESDRIAALASAQIEVRAGAVLLGSGGAKHQAPDALPQSADNTRSADHLLVEPRQENRNGMLPDKKAFR
jgi:transposase